LPGSPTNQDLPPDEFVSSMDSGKSPGREVTETAAKYTPSTTTGASKAEAANWSPSTSWTTVARVATRTRSSGIPSSFGSSKIDRTTRVPTGEAEPGCSGEP
jgi:hypothetical protein